MKRNDTPTNLKIFTILIIIGVIAGIVDGVVYQLHIKDNGIGLFTRVPWNVLWSYTKTFPGNLLTALWVLPWAFAFIWLALEEKISEFKEKRKVN
jgi:hypothetical protein